MRRRRIGTGGARVPRASSGVLLSGIGNVDLRRMTQSGCQAAFEPCSAGNEPGVARCAIALQPHGDMARPVNHGEIDTTEVIERQRRPVGRAGRDVASPDRLFNGNRVDARGPQRMNSTRCSNGHRSLRSLRRPSDAIVRGRLACVLAWGREGADRSGSCVTPVVEAQLELAQFFVLSHQRAVSFSRLLEQATRSNAVLIACANAVRLLIG